MSNEVNKILLGIFLNMQVKISPKKSWTFYFKRSTFLLCKICLFLFNIFVKYKFETFLGSNIWEWSNFISDLMWCRNCWKEALFLKLNIPSISDKGFVAHRLNRNPSWGINSKFFAIIWFIADLYLQVFFVCRFRWDTMT